jgi:hypothetical protein
VQVGVLGLRGIFFGTCDRDDLPVINAVIILMGVDMMDAFIQELGRVEVIGIHLAAFDHQVCFGKGGRCDLLVGFRSQLGGGDFVAITPLAGA